jgi:hypothetical protein
MTIHIDWLSVAIGATGMSVLWIFVSMFSLLMDYKEKELLRRDLVAKAKLKEMFKTHAS